MRTPPRQVDGGAARRGQLSDRYSWPTFEELLPEREFFIRKALGWTLRECSKKYPEQVAEFLLRVGERASGLTRREFCQRRGIPITTLDYWRRSHRRKPRLVEVSVAASEPGSGFTLGLANGRRIESSWRFDEGELTRLIRIAESA